MHPNLFFLIPTIIAAFVLPIPPCFSQENVQYARCGDSFRCGNIDNIVYPFWGGDWPDYCGGHRAFQLHNCVGDQAPLLRIGPIKYRVLLLDRQNRSLTLARDDLYNQPCTTLYFNTTFDSNLFDPFPTNKNLGIHYDWRVALVKIKKESTCTLKASFPLNYYLSYTETSNNRIGTSSNFIMVPVNETSSRALVNHAASVSDLQVALASGFGVWWTGNQSLCNECSDSGGRCGSITGSNSFACYCTNGVFDTRCNPASQNGSSTPSTGPSRPSTGPSTPSTGSNLGMKLAIGFSISGGAVTMVILVTIFYYRRRRFMAKNKQMDDKNVKEFLTNHGSLALKRFAYTDIKKMTNSFADKIGEGGYGSVFKGKLINGRLVAVKVLTDTDGNGGDFINEVASISRTSHVNIVTLLGFCLERNKRALVYEFMPNKSLENFIHKSESSSSLDLETLYKIAVGTARGLEYLHRGCNTRIVHFDIKPENILLDEEFCPKISDFGLAKLCQRKKSIISVMGARGTPGYIAPEIFSRSFGGVSHKSDVYSYGMMVINMVGAGQNNVVGSGLDSTNSEMYFPNFIYKRLERGEDLSGLRGLASEEEEQTAKKMVLVSLWCIQTNPLDRPSMSNVVEMLEGNIESIQVPPKPILFAPATANQDSCSALSSSYEHENIEEIEHENIEESELQ